jgi:IS30 family transposase
VLEKLKLGWSPQQISGRLKGEVNEVVNRLNSTPRKVLGYQIPLEVFTAHIMKVFGLTLEFRPPSSQKQPFLR